jgi:putative peptidoglycan lipid II flippase
MRTRGSQMGAFVVRGVVEWYDACDRDFSMRGMGNNMDGGWGPPDQSATRRARLAADHDGRLAEAFEPLGAPNDTTPGAPHPYGAHPEGMRPAGAAPLWPAEPDDADDENPPWDRPSGRIPVPAPNTTTRAAQVPAWEWDPALEESIPGMSIGGLSGTGKIPALVPLSPDGSGWSKGVRAPSGPNTSTPGAVALPIPGDVEVDDQPSAQMRALRVGNLARATMIITAALLLSRVLGLLRTTLFAAAFGAQSDAVTRDAFTNAFALPDTIFNIVAGGALASAFIPIFADYLIDKRDKKTAWHIASASLNLSILALTALSVLGLIFAPQFLNITLHPLFGTCGAHPDTCEGNQVVNLTRIMLLQPIFLGGATIAVAILQARQSFVLPAIGQVIYSASLVAGIAATMLDKRFGIFGGDLGILGPTYAVVVGAALQFVIQVPGLARAKMQYAPSLDIAHPGVRKMFRLMVPRILNAMLLYVSVYVTRSLLDLVPNQKDGATYGYVTAFTLVLLPIGIFGMAISQAAFPTMAALVAANEWQRLRDTILRTVRGVTYLALPSALGLIVLAYPISRLMVFHGNFTAAQISQVSTPLLFFAVGLLGLALVEILTRCFYALHDSRTAVEVSVLQFMFVIGLSIVLLQPMGAGGLALATSLGSLGEALVLLLLLRNRLGGLDLKELGIFTLNALAASVVAALAALFAYTLLLVIFPYPVPDGASPTENALMIVRVGVPIVVAAVTYFVFARFLGIDDVMPLQRFTGRFARLLRR